MENKFTSDYGFYGSDGLNLSWRNYLFGIATAVSGRSKDTRKVGAILVGEDKSVLATGFNGFPIGVDDDKERHPNRYDRELYKYQYTSHAEANLISFAAKHGIATNGLTVFCNLVPCVECTKLLIQAGIKEIYCLSTSKGRGKWRQDIIHARVMLLEAGVKFHQYNMEEDIFHINTYGNYSVSYEIVKSIFNIETMYINSRIHVPNEPTFTKKYEYVKSLDDTIQTAITMATEYISHL